MKERFSLQRIGPMIAAPLLALIFSMAISSLVLIISGRPPLHMFSVLLGELGKPRIQVQILNAATTYYLSAIAVAIGFRMNLFNIGVDGQYRLAAMVAAAFGSWVVLPAPLHVASIIVVAMLVGAAWAGIAALLKVTRGVSEVISTIMLNFIAGQIIAYLLQPGRLAESVEGSNNVTTKPLPPSGQMPGLHIIPGAPPSAAVYGSILIAVAVGVAYWFVLNRTRFGFDLRATGRSESAAVASGVNVKRMVVLSMLMSGAVAGLVGMPLLLGSTHSYSLDFPVGLGFTGIAIALLGRNHPVGIAFGALLWGFLDSSATRLNFEGIPQEIVAIMQGVLVLSVVVAYELVRRYRVRQAGREVARRLGAGDTVVPEGAPA